MLRALALLMLSGIAIGVVAISASEIRPWLVPGSSRQASDGTGEAEWLVLALCGLLAGTPLLAIGVRWALGHHARTRRTLAWLGCVCLLMWGVPNFATATQAFFGVGPRYYANGSTLPQPTPLRLEIGHWLEPALLTLLGAAVWGLGPLADRFGRYTRQQAWMTRLSRSRRRRARRRS